MIIIGEEEEKKVPEWMKGAAKSGGWEKHALELSEKSARDFKDAMGSIEDSGKMGTFASMAALYQIMMDFLGSPFIKTFTDMLSTLQKFMDSGGAEAAAKWREALFSDENIKQMEQMRDGWYDISNAITDTYMNIKKTKEELDKINFIDWLGDVDKMGKDAGQKIIKAIIDGIDDAKDDLEDYFEDLIENL